MENSYKRIVCDIDDTISITTNRDWKNAKPIQEVINKINEFYDLGWEIYLCTARGYLSCNGDRKEADIKYRAQIEEWLKIHNVKYHVLTFEKILAQYYIDDKSLTPQQFTEINIKQLKSGWSGAHIELRDNKVYKTHSNSLLTCEWYDIAKSFFNVPKIYSLIGETICMEYIENDEQIKMNEVVDIFKNMKQIPAHEDSSDFSSYIERIKNHSKLANNQFDDIVKILSMDNYVQTMNKCKSFCHGDFSYDNILHNNEKLYLIDPIYEPKSYSSWLLDVSKFLFSLKYKNKIVEYNYVFSMIARNLLKNDNNIYETRVACDLLKLLIKSQAIRVYKYAPDFEKKKIISFLYTSL